MKMLDSLVMCNTLHGAGLCDGDFPTRTSVIRWLIRTEFNKLEERSRRINDAKEAGRKFLAKEQKSPLPTPKGK